MLRDRLDAGAICGSCKRALLPGRPIELTAANFDCHVAGNDLPVVVDFWVNPCALQHDWSHREWATIDRCQCSAGVGAYRVEHKKKKPVLGKPHMRS